MRGFTLAGVHHHAQIVLIAQLALVAQTGLGLFYGFAGIVLIASWRLTRVILPFVIAQAARVISFNIHAVKQQGQFAVVINAHAELRVGEVLTRAAMVAGAVSGEAVGGNHIVDIARMAAVADRAGRFHTVMPGTEAAVVAAGFESGRLAAGLGGGVNHPAGGVAVQGGKRPAQYFERIEAANINIRGLSLAIRHGGRNAVDVNSQPTHAVGGAGAEATNRKLQILRIVLTVLHL